MDLCFAHVFKRHLFVDFLYVGIICVWYVIKLLWDFGWNLSSVEEVLLCDVQYFALVNGSLLLKVLQKLNVSNMEYAGYKDRIVVI